MSSQQQKIPEGWAEKKIVDIVSKIEGGGTPSKKHPKYWNGSIPWASVKDIVTHSPEDTQDHITKLGLNSSSSRLIPKGVLITPTRMALGHAVFFNIDVAINQDLKAIYPKNGLSKNYLYYWFKTKKTFIKRLGSGSTVSGIQLSDLRSIKFLLPPLPEQNRVVQVLETWDKYLDLLDQKIKIKKNIKKGLIQNLLTGKKRLRGFCKKWNNKKLGEISTMRSGGTPKSTVPEYYGGNIPWVSITDMTSNGKYLFETNKNLSQIGLENSSAVIYPKGTVLYAMYASIGECSISGVEMSSSQAILGIQANPKMLNSLFLYYWLSSIKEKIKLQGQQGTQANLNAGMVRDLEIDLPEIKEQNAIAEVLTKADKEIQSLEKQQQIIADQKKYLLNNLITGQIRLPEFVKN